MYRLFIVVLFIFYCIIRTAIIVISKDSNKTEDRFEKMEGYGKWLGLAMMRISVLISIFLCLGWKVYFLDKLDLLNIDWALIFILGLGLFIGNVLLHFEL